MCKIISKGTNFLAKNIKEYQRAQTFYEIILKGKIFTKEHQQIQTSYQRILKGKNLLQKNIKGIFLPNYIKREQNFVQ